MQLERAAARYLQIRDLELAIQASEESIAAITDEIADAEERLAEVRKTKSELLKDLRAAACDEGQLPLFDLPAVLAKLPMKPVPSARKGKKKR